jgi:hypothetical protein
MSSAAFTHSTLHVFSDALHPTGISLLAAAISQWLGIWQVVVDAVNVADALLA